MKCSVCSVKIEKIFLSKILGTVVYIDAKPHYVCSKCQKQHPNLKDHLASLA